MLTIVGRPWEPNQRTWRSLSRRFYLREDAADIRTPESRMSLPALDVLESLGMVRTTKGATGDTFVDGYLLIEYARYINNYFGILVLRGFELWQHQQAGQEAPENEVGPGTWHVAGALNGEVYQGPGNV